MRNVRSATLASAEQFIVPDTAMLEPATAQPFSIALWLKCNGSVPTATVLSKYNLQGYKIAIDVNDQLVFTIEDSDGIAGSITGNTSLLPDVWYLIVATRDAVGNVNLYLNGVPDETETVTNNEKTLADAVNLLLGGTNFVGELGEVQIILGAELTEAQALDLYKRGTSKGLKPSYPSGDVRFWARWKNRVFKDNSGYGNEMSGSGLDRSDRNRIAGYR